MKVNITSFKRVAIDKATKSILSAMVGASVITVFGLVASRALYNQLRYQNKVISAKKEAVKNLRSNVSAVNSLTAAYKTFNEEPESIIGTSDRNTKVVLDALPSKYDFPALATSLESFLAPYQNPEFIGIDDELAQANAGPSQLVEIPMTLSASGDYEAMQRLLDEIDRIIRPMKILKMNLKGGQNDMTIILPITTYYQSEKRFEFVKKEIQ